MRQLRSSPRPRRRADETCVSCVCVVLGDVTFPSTDVKEVPPVTVAAWHQVIPSMRTYTSATVSGASPLPVDVVFSCLVVFVCVCVRVPTVLLLFRR